MKKCRFILTFALVAMAAVFITNNHRASAAPAETYAYEVIAEGDGTGVRIVASGGVLGIFDYVSGSQYTFNGVGNIQVNYATPGTGTLGGTPITIGNVAAFKAAFPSDKAQSISVINVTILLDFGKTNSNLQITAPAVNLCKAGVSCTATNYNPVLMINQNHPNPNVETLSQSTVSFDSVPFSDVIVGKKYTICAAASFIKAANNALCKTVTATKSPLSVLLKGKGDPTKLGKVAPITPKDGSNPGNNPGPTDCVTLDKCDLVSKYLNPLIKVMSAMVGLAVVISVVIGGIQYSTSAGDPQKVSAAKNRIRNSIIALVAFLFLFALLNFLIPGGLT